MKRNRILLTCMIALVIGALLTGCKTDNKEETNKKEATTVAGKLANQFLDEAGENKDMEQVAEGLASSELLSDLSMVTMSVEEGFLNGFDAEIKGFNKGIMISPMIGSIPFVAYVFETTDSEALVKTINEHAKLDWNICTAADELKTEVVDQYVFVVMAPNSFDE